MFSKNLTFRTQKPEIDGQEKSIKKYEPWNDSFAMAVNFAVGATLFVWFAVLYKKLHGGGIGILALSGVLMVVALSLFFKGMSREFGKAFEEKVVNKATKAFSGTGLTILPRKMTNVGDIDLLVRGKTGKLGNIEVKTWRYYGESDKFAVREKKVLKQIKGQHDSVDAHISVLWLPQASQGWIDSIFNPFPKIDKSIYLCCGNARKLKRLLKRKIN